MAQQDGIIKIQGTLGGITFYKTRDGYMVREKGGISKNRMKKDPAFRRTRENGQEFGTAGRYGKFIRKSIRPLLLNSNDKRVVSRLVKQLMDIIKTDTINSRGLRTPLDGQIELLKGFEFNSNGLLSNTLFMDYVNSLDRSTGEVEVMLPEINPTQMIAAPAGTTHFKVVSAATEIDFISGETFSSYDSSTEIEYQESLQPEIVLSTSVTPDSTLPIFHFLGIEFYQQINNDFYMLNNGSFNALSIINISKE